jgi:hypothetical protein
VKVYLLDWHGTLTTLGDHDAIKAFLDALHEQGDYTFGHSGMLPKGTEGWFTFGNSKMLGEQLESLAVGKVGKEACYRHMDPEDRDQRFDTTRIDEIVYSDDKLYDASDTYMARLTKRTGGIPVRFVKPDQLLMELDLYPRLKWMMDHDKTPLPACKHCGRVMLAGWCCKAAKDAAKFSPE